MAIRTVLHFPDPRLRNKGIDVPETDMKDQAFQTLIDDMFETMYHDYGCGLAATQINITKRLIVIDLSDDKSQPICLINPQILKREGQKEMKEGCLSVPGVYEGVPRAEYIEATAIDRYGKLLEIKTDGLLAHCIQHEIDHLDGKLFIDYLSPLKRKFIQKKLQKYRRETL